MFPLLPYTHIHTAEQLPLYRDGERNSKIDLTIRRNWNRHRLVFLDFLCSDCFTGTYYRLRLDENTYINLPEDEEQQPITLTDFYRELRDFIASHDEIAADLINDGEGIVIKLFPSSPLLFLERLDDREMMELIRESTSNEQESEPTLRDEFRSRWTRLATQILNASPKSALLHSNSAAQVNYITALRYGLRKSPAATVSRTSRLRRRSVSATR